MVDKKILENRIISSLKTIYDPEIPVDIYELGLIYEINIDEKSNVVIMMTLTSPSCPVAESLPVDVENRIKGLQDVNSVKVNIIFEPTWTIAMMSDEAKFEMGFM